MKVYYINNAGTGFAEQIEVADGTTLGALFAQKMPDKKPDHYVIRKDRLPAPADEVLNEGCRVSFTPTKIDGADEAARATDLFAKAI